MDKEKNRKPKSRTVALFLAAFPYTGILGIDRMYLGYWGIGILKFLTGGVFLILYIADIVRIAKGTLNDKQGHPLVRRTDGVVGKIEDGTARAAQQIGQTADLLREQCKKPEKPVIPSDRRLPENICAVCEECPADKPPRIYGVLLRHNYDDRENTAQVSQGITTYAAVGIVKLPFCKKCRARAVTKAFLRAFCMLFGGLACFGIGRTMGDNTGAGLAAVCFLLLVVGLIGFFSVPVSLACGTEYAVNSLVQIDPGYVLTPRGEELDVRVVRSDLSNRHSYHYRYLPERVLLKPPEEKGAATSRKAAVNGLRAWYRTDEVRQSL